MTLNYESKGPELLNIESSTRNVQMLSNSGISVNLGDSEANHQTQSPKTIEIETQADFGTFKLPKCLICQFNCSLNSNFGAKPTSDEKKKCSTENHELQQCKPIKLEIPVIPGI